MLSYTCTVSARKLLDHCIRKIPKLNLGLNITQHKTLFPTKKMDILFLHETYVVGTYEKCLSEALLLSTHNMFFVEIRKKIRI